MDFAKGLQQANATILFVSGNMFSIKTMYQRVIYLAPTKNAWVLQNLGNSGPSDCRPCPYRTESGYRILGHDRPAERVRWRDLQANYDLGLPMDFPEKSLVNKHD